MSKGLPESLFPQYATELLFFLFETGRHDKQHTFTKGSQGYFSLKRQYIINFIVESEIENVFIEQRPPITQLMRKESFLHNPMIFSYEPNFFNLVTRFATAFLDSPLTTDCSHIHLIIHIGNTIVIVLTNQHQTIDIYLLPNRLLRKNDISVKTGQRRSRIGL